MAVAVEDYVVPDNPTNNFATLNPLENSHPSSVTVGKGNLYISSSTDLATLNIILATIGMPLNSGKFYYETFITNGNDTNAGYVGLTNTSNYRYVSGATTTNLNGNATGTLSVGADNTPNIYVVNNSSNQYSTSGNLSNAIIGIFFDSNNLQVKVFLNNTEIYDGSMTTDTGLFFPVFCSRRSDNYIVVNFGQDSSFNGNKTIGSAKAADANGHGDFYYAPPTGALALCTQNIPTPSIDSAAGNEPEDFFKTVIWTGNGSSRNIEVGFQPDLVWIKNRNNSSQSTHAPSIFDSARSNGHRLVTHDTNADQNYSTHFGSIISSGFSLPSSQVFNDSLSSPAGTYVAWCWKAGGTPSGATSATGSAKRINTSGTQDDTSCNALTTAASATITPTLMSINQKSGFSIIKWVGNNTNNASIPHGLTKTPDFVAFKNTSDTVNWGVKLNPNTIPAVSNEQQYLYLNLTNPFGTNTGEETQLTSSIIKFVGTNLNFSNGSGDNMIAYCWHAVEGYSAFGSYTGNGSPDGPFVYTGFRPSWIIVKWLSGGGLTTGSWRIMDTARNPYNPATLDLMANETVTETTYGSDDLDILSNGFKWRSTGSFHNYNNANYMYMAFAEQPVKYSNAR